MATMLMTSTNLGHVFGDMGCNCYDCVGGGGRARCGPRPFRRRVKRVERQQWKREVNGTTDYRS